MANYAVIKNGIVDNIVIADTKEIAEEVTSLTCIEYENTIDAPGIGWTYDGTNFSAPVIETPTE